MKEKVVSFVVIAVMLVAGLFYCVNDYNDMIERNEQIWKEQREQRERIMATYDEVWEQMGKIVEMKMASSGN